MINKDDVEAAFGRIAERKNKLKVVGSDSSGSREFLRQAAVKSELLTNDPNWDTYLSYIQQQIESLEGMVAAATEKVLDPKTLDHEELIRAKMVAGESKAMIRAFTMAMGYPKAIMEQQARVKKSEEGGCKDTDTVVER